MDPMSQRGNRGLAVESAEFERRTPCQAEKSPAVGSVGAPPVWALLPADMEMERWSPCPAETDGRCVCRTSNSEPRLSPRRKPGSINAVRWNIGPGFRRGDSEL